MLLNIQWGRKYVDFLGPSIQILPLQLKKGCLYDLSIDYSGHERTGISMIIEVRW